MIDVKTWIRGTVLSVIGGLIGSALFAFLINRGIYAPLIIGGMVGVFGGATLRRVMPLMGAQCVGVAFVLQVLLEAELRPFIDNAGTATDESSLLYFVTHLHRLDPISILGLRVPGLVFWLVGLALAFGFGIGRNTRFGAVVPAEDNDVSE